MSSPTETCCIFALRRDTSSSFRNAAWRTLASRNDRELNMPKRYWEDFKTGEVAVYGPRLVTREEIVAFAAEFDPQPMHLDEAAASATLLGGLAASGWHMCSLLMRTIADGFILDSSSMGAPGIEELRWLKPLRPGTQIRVRVTVLDTRASKSRPEMGLTRFRYDMIDEADAVIMSLTVPTMFGRRRPGAAP